jgi:hypothetical protein
MHVGIAEGSDEKYWPDKIMTLYKTPAICFFCIHTIRRDMQYYISEVAGRRLQTVNLDGEFSMLEAF